MASIASVPHESYETEPTSRCDATAVAQLRATHYNAEVTSIARMHDELMIMRVRPDWSKFEFSPGQYTVIGCGNWERSVDGGPNTVRGECSKPQLVRRAYSISSPILDTSGKLVRADDATEVEFYIALVRRSDRHTGLTPRLFALAAGNRMMLGRQAHGRYSLAGVRSDDAVVFAATGTGEAPHNTMIATLLASGHRGPIAAVVCVRRRCDLGYLSTYRRLERMFPNVRYITLTTRERENLDPAAVGYVGKRYLQHYFASGDFERDTGISLWPTSTHVFLCGNPRMISVPSKVPGSEQGRSAPSGMVEILQQRGFTTDRPHSPGNIHFEKYW